MTRRRDSDADWEARSRALDPAKWARSDAADAKVAADRAAYCASLPRPGEPRCEHGRHPDRCPLCGES